MKVTVEEMKWKGKPSSWLVAEVYFYDQLFEYTYFSCTAVVFSNQDFSNILIQRLYLWEEYFLCYMIPEFDHCMEMYVQLG